MTKPSKQQLWEYFILAVRVCLAWQLGSYGYAKLTEGQFGVTDEILATPLKNVDLFKLSWYMADHEPFKTFIGVSQLVAAALLLYNRSLLLGAFMSIPIWMNILLWDVTYMPPSLAFAFSFRISFYLLLTGLILWRYKERMLSVWRALTQGTFFASKIPLWAYLFLPVLAFAIDLVWVIPKSTVAFLLKWLET